MSPCMAGSTLICISYVEVTKSDARKWHYRAQPPQMARMVSMASTAVRLPGLAEYTLSHAPKGRQEQDRLSVPTPIIHPARIEFSNVALLACERNTNFHPHHILENPAKWQHPCTPRHTQNAELLSFSYTVLAGCLYLCTRYEPPFGHAVRIRNFFPSLLVPSIALSSQRLHARESKKCDILGVGLRVLALCHVGCSFMIYMLKHR